MSTEKVELFLTFRIISFLICSSNMTVQERNKTIYLPLIDIYPLIVRRAFYLTASSVSRKSPLREREAPENIRELIHNSTELIGG